MEYFANKAQDRIVIVDYAHNRLSFLPCMKQLRLSLRMKIVTVFGCPAARHIAEGFGAAGGQHSDKVILTAEDPGPEDTRAISEDIGSAAAQRQL